MGWNTSVILMNDALGSIAKDPEFGRKLELAALSCSHEGRIDVSAGCHYNAASVIESHHADQLSVVSFGGNCGINLTKPTVTGWRNNDGTIEGNLSILTSVADQMGFTLRKKRSKRS